MITDEQKEEAYTRIGQGESLSQVAKHFKVDKSNLYRFLTKTEEDLQQYARARELQAQTYVDNVIDMAKDMMAGVSSEQVPSKRAAIDAFKWIACKFYPKMYGDKIHNEHSGAIGFDWRPVAERGTSSDKK